MISSRYSTRDHPCKFPEKIYYSESLNQQGKKKIKCASKYQDKKQQEIENKDVSRLRMHTYNDWWTTS